MLKAYQCDDGDVYAANDAEEAKRLWRELVGGDEAMDEDYPRELDAAELDKRYPAFDEDERPIDGQTTSVRKMLEEHGNEPGWLCGSDW